jgi:type IV secretory pathway protease TraF
VALVDNAAKGPLQPSLRFAPQSVPLGELRITGKFIQRLLLPGGQTLVVLNQPAETVKVPVGRYRPPEVQLGPNSSLAVRNPNFLETETGTEVTASSPSVIVDGGPLTNRVIVNREGRDLRFDYRLIGAREQPYRLVGLVQQPEWSVFRGETKIASGKFEFG